MNERSRTDTTQSRRVFLNRLWAALGALALVETVAVVTAYFRPRKATARVDAAAVITAGPVDEFEPGSVSAFVRGKFYLARLEDGGFLAMSRSCTHLGCSVPWFEKENRFICPCHASEFDIRGDVISAPAPRALDLYRVEIENGILSVDTSQPLKRSAFASDQAVYPETT